MRGNPEDACRTTVILSYILLPLSVLIASVNNGININIDIININIQPLYQCIIVVVIYVLRYLFQRIRRIPRKLEVFERDSSHRRDRERMRQHRTTIRTILW